MMNHVVKYNKYCTYFFLQKKEIISFWESYHHQPLTGRNKILASFCPQVYGLYVVKLAVAMALVGGVQVNHLHF